MGQGGTCVAVEIEIPPLSWRVSYCTLVCFCLGGGGGIGPRFVGVEREGGGHKQSDSGEALFCGIVLCVAWLDMVW